jgi:hypothetical protein
MSRASIVIRGAWVKWHALDYLGVKKRKRLKHLVVTDEYALVYWEQLYKLSRRP